MAEDEADESSSVSVTAGTVGVTTGTMTVGVGMTTELEPIGMMTASPGARRLWA